MKSRIVAVLMVTALLAGACGSRTDDSSEEGTDGSTDTSAPASGSAEGMFGTLDSPCGPGDASGATDVGVTDEAITVTSYSDSGGAVGGLNKGIDDSSAAFVEWCNDQGGINGRLINLEFRQAGLFSYGEVVAPACADSLALVGGLAVFDDSGAQTQVDCGLPNIPAAAVSSIQSGADLTWQVLPSPPNQLTLGMATELKRLHPEVIDAAGMVQANIASVEYIAVRMKEAMTKIGYTFVYNGVQDIGEANWPTFVVDMQSKGVKYFTAESTPEEIVNLQNAMALQNFSPEVTGLETNFYQLQYPTMADGNAEGAYVQLSTWPFNEADDNAAMTTYLEALRKTNGADVLPEQLGVQSWSAWLMWATAVKSLGSDVTRAGLADALDKVTSWDGGGLHGTSNPAGNEAAPCFVLMQVQGDGFTRVFPTEADDAAVFSAGKGFSCNPDYVVDLDTDYDDGAKAPA